MHPRRGNGFWAALAGTLVALCLGWMATSTALADGPAGPDPTYNFPVGQMPLACASAPTSTACINGAVYWLDRARAKLGQGPYMLPADFATLSADKQVFILVNLDRLQYGLDPITGLTQGLDQSALVGVRDDADPTSTNPDFWDGDWAGAYTNMVVAYEEWMYDDGLGSTNLDCTQADPSGCWGHRHGVLWDFSYELGPYAMGAAAALDNSGRRGYTILLGRGDSTYQPTYYYTWDDAVQDGASTNTYVVTAPPVLAVKVKAQGNKIHVYVSAPAHAQVACQLSSWYGGRWHPEKPVACPEGITYTSVSRGRYRLVVKGAGKTVTRYVTVS